MVCVSSVQGRQTSPARPPRRAARFGVSGALCHHRGRGSSPSSCVSSSLCSKSWVNIYCVLREGRLTFYKDARNRSATYNEEPPVDLGSCSFDPSMGYKKKKNVFILQ